MEPVSEDELKDYADCISSTVKNCRKFLDSLKPEYYITTKYGDRVVSILPPFSTSYHWPSSIQHKEFKWYMIRSPPPPLEIEIKFPVNRTGKEMDEMNIDDEYARAVVYDKSDKPRSYYQQKHDDEQKESIKRLSESLKPVEKLPIPVDTQGGNSKCISLENILKDIEDIQTNEKLPIPK